MAQVCGAYLTVTEDGDGSRELLFFFFWLMSNNTSLRFEPHTKSQNENKTNLLSVKFKLNNSRPKNILLLFADNVESRAVGRMCQTML